MYDLRFAKGIASQFRTLGPCLSVNLKARTNRYLDKPRAGLQAVYPQAGAVDKRVAQGTGLCLDLVLSYLAREHPRAVAAPQGDPRYRGYCYIYPRALERTLPDIFPDSAPGSFAWYDEVQGWVWTNFNSWQWEVNWSSLDAILWLANQGGDVFRLDAISFTWMRMSTNCQNQPEAHALTQALCADVRTAAPAVDFKAEAIVAPENLTAYLGTKEQYDRVSELTYHNTLVVQTWSSLASPLTPASSPRPYSASYAATTRSCSLTTRSPRAHCLPGPT